MRPICLLVLYLVAVFAGGALLAPWLYHLAQWGAGHWSALENLARNPFSRFVVRSILGLALLGLWPLLRACGMLKAKELGLVNNKRVLANLAAGLAIGFFSLALAAGLAVVAGGRTANLSHSRPELVHSLSGAVATAVIVAILEELLFRGALFGLLRKSLPWPWALAGSSAVYAAGHFLQRAPTPAHIDWLSGLRILPEMFRPQEGGLTFVPAFFTLLVAGAILALAYQRTGALFMSMGIHAGWIFWLAAYRFLTKDAPGASLAWWGTDKLIDGWLPCLILALVFAGLCFSGRPVAGRKAGAT